MSRRRPDLAERTGVSEQARVDERAAARGHGAMLLFAALISMSFTLGDLAAPHIEPSVLTAARFGLAAVIMGVLAGPRIRAAHVEAAWRYLLLGGLLASYFILMFEALRLTDPVSTGAVFTLTPIMSAAFGYLLMRQITGPAAAFALLLAGAGAVWVIFRADVEAMLGMELGLGERIFLIGCACHALYTPMGRKLHRGEPLTVYTFFGICGGLLVAAAYANRSLFDTDWIEPPPDRLGLHPLSRVGHHGRHLLPGPIRHASPALRQGHGLRLSGAGLHHHLGRSFGTWLGGTRGLAGRCGHDGRDAHVATGVGGVAAETLQRYQLKRVYFSIKKHS